MQKCSASFFEVFLSILMGRFCACIAYNQFYLGQSTIRSLKAKNNNYHRLILSKIFIIILKINKNYEHTFITIIFIFVRVQWYQQKLPLYTGRRNIPVHIEKIIILKLLLQKHIYYVKKLSFCIYFSRMQFN